MKLLLILLACFAGPSFESPVLFLNGVSSMEELDESVISRYRALELSPLELNLCTRSRLLSSGLMSAFQVASLLDWRERSGDILSYTELALVDGFGEEYAEALKPFTRLSSSGPPGKRRSRKLHQNLMLRGAGRLSGELEYAAGVKYKAELGETAELYWSSRNSYSDPHFGLGTLSGAYYGRKHLGKLILGHFNARFGQGLCMWSGFSLQPWSSVQSLRRSGSGFSPTGSFSPSYCGAAADFEYGRWSLAAAYSVPDKMPMGSVCFTGQRFTAAVNASREAVGMDIKLGLPGLGLWGECVWRGRFDAVAGVMWIPAYDTKIGAMAKWCSGVPETAAGVSSGPFKALAYLSSKQFRSMAKYSTHFHLGPIGINPVLRLAATRKDTWRVEGRGVIRLEYSGWDLTGRLDLVHCKDDTSWLFYAEAGRGGGAFRAWLRWTLFRVDKWDGRIYVYERDAPGSFNVPAYYGKGWATSLSCAWKPSRRHGFYCRLSCVEYPWMTDGKASKYEVKLQYQLSL